MSQDPPVLTKEFLSQNTVVFYPRDEDEARAIQERLIRRGFAWQGGDWQVKNIGECVALGLTLYRGVIYFHPQFDEDEPHVVSALGDFDPAPEAEEAAWKKAGMPVERPKGVKLLKLKGR